MAYTKTTWINDETELNAENMNHIESGIENSQNVHLIAVTNEAPAECTTGDKYYNSVNNKIYTATATNTWSEDGETPIEDILYIVLEEQSTYTYNGTTLISVGGGSGGETLPVGSKIGFEGNVTDIPDGWAVDTNTDEYYVSGDTYEVVDWHSFSGYITGSGTNIRFTIPLPKRLDKITSVVINKLELTIRQNGNYVPTNNTNMLTNSNVSSIQTYMDENTLTIRINGTFAWANAINNDAISVTGNMKFTFN